MSVIGWMWQAINGIFGRKPTCLESEIKIRDFPGLSDAQKMVMDNLRDDYGDFSFQGKFKGIICVIEIGNRDGEGIVSIPLNLSQKYSFDIVQSVLAKFLRNCGNKRKESFLSVKLGSPYECRMERTGIRCYGFFFDVSAGELRYRQIKKEERIL